MGPVGDFSHIPIVDLSGLGAGTSGRRAVAERLGEACRESGFFYVVGHGVDAELQARLRDLSRQFFAQDLESKLRIRMALGGRAWRGYFRVGDELTSGRPDQKEGLYFGAVLPSLIILGFRWGLSKNKKPPIPSFVRGTHLGTYQEALARAATIRRTS